MSSIVIVGAGWAGLNCAYELTKAGHEIILLEAAPQVGGRARSVQFGKHIVDNGQHVALGAYHNMRQILREMALDEASLFKILPLQISMFGSESMQLRLHNLPAPWNLLGGILTAGGFSWQEKFQILKFAVHLHTQKYQLSQDCTILELLLNYNQSKRVIEQLWEPIALAAISTNIRTASAQIFVNVLRQAFTVNKTNSNWYLPAVDLSKLLPEQIVSFLIQKQQQVICMQAIKSVQPLANAKLQVIGNAQSWHADHVVIATAPWQAIKILQAHPELQTLCSQLEQFNYEMITTVYLQFAQPLQLSYPMFGMLGSTSQWILDRAFAAQPDILSVVITGTIAEHFQDNANLYQQVLHEIQLHLPYLANPIAYKVIREKRAAFTCDVAIQKSRPTPRTALKNLWLCGDYLQTGLPATLEGALLSGKQTSWEILKTC